MTEQEFEAVCRGSGLKPVKKVPTDKGDIYIGEGFFDRHPAFDGPHYKTIWAVGKDRMIHAQPLYFGQKNINGVFRYATPDERIAATEQIARESLNGGNAP